MPAPLRSYLNEPAVPDPPVRVRRDWAVVAAASAAAMLEASLRNDEEWLTMSAGWQIAAVVTFFLVLPSLMIRRTRPLLAIFWAFVPTVAFSYAVELAEGVFGGLVATAVVLIVPYALYRWGSGRDGAIGAVVLVAAGVFGLLTDPTATLGDWIGGFIVLSIPVEAGLVVRYRASARERAIAEVTSREREELARELHDTVAHHVSAIAVQAQAGRAIAATDPGRAVDVLAVIEEAASRTLGEMRAMVRTLRDDAAVELRPRQGVSDLARLAGEVPGDLRVEVRVDAGLGPVGPAVDAAIFRIAQESITNAVRHARSASRVDVDVESAGDLVRLTVVDDGLATHAAGERGYGLLGMAERAQMLGGSLVAGPAKDRGWQVTAEFPRQEVRA